MIYDTIGQVRTLYEKTELKIKKTELKTVFQWKLEIKFIRLKVLQLF